MAIELQISLLLLFALGGYLLSARINQSAVVGIIAIGVLIGPSLFGIIEYTRVIEILAHLGAIVLLFSIGLEFKIRDVYQLRYLFIAFVGLILPWVGGYFLGTFFGYGFKESMFIGVALTATSIAITAKVLEEMEKLNTTAARAIIGAAVIDDILGLIALSIVVQLTKGSVSSVSLVIVVVEAGLFVVAGILAAPYIKNILVKLDEKKFAKRHPDFLFITAMAFCFLYASVAELIGLSAIVGAFLSGAVLEGVKFKHSRDLKEGAEYLHIIFGAIFFISLGILVNLRELSLKILPFLLIMLIVAMLTKFIGCGVSSRLVGFNRNDSNIIGVGMSPRGEVAMIIALIGLTSNTIKQDLYIAIIVMALLTTVLTPIIIRKLRWQ